MDHFLKTPLLLVVDDHYKTGGAAELILHAHKIGVHVRTFESTLAAEAWIQHNIGTLLECSSIPDIVEFLRKHNTGAPEKVRVVTDVVRLEDQGDGNGLQAHGNAGYRIIRFIRERFDNIPVLVFTSHNNVVNTKWVKDIWLAGSTSDYKVVEEYVNQLGGVSKHNCNVQWAQYNAQ